MPDETALPPSPWHDGERKLQRRSGVEEQLEKRGQHVIRPFMPEQHRQFFALLPFVLAGSLDPERRPWASLLAGPPGFATSPEPTLLRIDALPVAGDPLDDALVPGLPIGLLGIELPTRRRNRLNGRILARDGRGFTVAVDQSFGNCPQYIQRRDYAAMIERRPTRAEPFAALGDEPRRLVASADVLFVATSAGRGDDPVADGRDVSHRGGKPGFVRVDPDGTLTIPDFSGNRFFMTLGNIAANPRAGLLFLDLARGDLLQLTGDAELVLEGAELARFHGAERLWRVHPTGGRWLRGALALRFDDRDPSPNVAETGDWQPK